MAEGKAAAMYPIPGVTQHFVNVYGIRMAYRKAGAGPPVVLLHGLGASSLTWTANIPALAGQLTVYALDMPGHGDSDKLAIDYGMDTGVQMFRGFLDRLGLDRVALVGNSMGGLVALRCALDYPDRVTHLVLVDSAGLGRRLSWTLRLASVPLLGEVLLNKSIITVRGLAGRMFVMPERIDHGLLRALHRARTAQVATHVMLAMARAGATLAGLKQFNYLLPRLGEVAARLLVVWGEKDKVFRADHAREVARRYPHVTVHIFPAAAHWPHMEQADAFNEIVLRFLGTELPIQVRDSFLRSE